MASLAAVYARLLARPPGLAPDVPTPALAPLLADLCQQAAQVGLDIHLIATGTMVIHATLIVFPSHATCDGHFHVKGHAQKNLHRSDLLWPGAAGAGGRGQAARCGSRALLAGRAAALRLQRAARGWPGARGVRCGGRPERCLGGSRAAVPAFRHSLACLPS